MPSRVAKPSSLRNTIIQAGGLLLGVAALLFPLLLWVGQWVYPAAITWVGTVFIAYLALIVAAGVAFWWARQHLLSPLAQLQQPTIALVPFQELAPSLAKLVVLDQQLAQLQQLSQQQQEQELQHRQSLQSQLQQAEQGSQQAAEAMRQERDRILKLTDELEQKQHFEASLSRLTDVAHFKADETLASWSERVVQYLAQELGVAHAALHGLQEDTVDAHQLQLLGVYAAGLKPGGAVSQLPTLGLALEVMRQRRTIHLRNLEDQVVLTGGFAELRIKEIILLPLVAESAFVGYLELASVENLVPHQLEYLQRAVQLLAFSLLVLRNNQRIGLLLSEAQGKNLELTSREEELRQNLEELEATQEEMKRVQREIQAQQDRFQKMADSVPGVIFQAELDDRNDVPRFVYVSNASKATLGVEPELLLENYYALHEVTLEEDRVPFRQVVAKSAQELTPYVFEARLTTSGDQHEELRHIRIEAAPEAIDKHVTRWSGIILDITDRKHKEAELRHNLDALKAAQKEMTRAQQRAELLNRTLEEKVQERTQALEAALVEVQATQQKVASTEKLAAFERVLGGIMRELNSPVSSIKASTEVGLAAYPRVLRAVPSLLEALPTEKRTQLVAHLLAVSRKKEMSLRSSKLERACRKELLRSLTAASVPGAEELARKLAKVCHLDEVPMLTALLVGTDADAVTSAIYDASQVMMSLESVFLANTRAFNVYYSLKAYNNNQEFEEAQWFQLHESLKAAVEEYPFQFRAGVSLECRFAVGLVVKGVPDDLHLVWTNLIQNALQSMEGQGRLILNLYGAGEHAIVEVIDSGPGFDAQLQARLFEDAFAEDASNPFALSYYIARKLVEKQQGNIGVVSEPGRTCITVSLPLQQVPAH